MAKILHLKDWTDHSAFIEQVIAMNELLSRFDLYWNRDLGWLWTTQDAGLFKKIKDFYAEYEWQVIDTTPPKPADTVKIITLN